MTDNKTGRPLAAYCAAFAVSDPEELSARSGVPFENGGFSLRLLSRPVRVSVPDMEVCFAGSGEAVRPAVRILLGRLLLEGALVPSGGRFLAYSQFPWGGVYNAQFTARCIRRLAAVWGGRLADFSAACERLGGKRITGGDAGYELEFLDGLFVRLLLWESDGEFPASAQIVFSDNFAAAFSAEDMAVVGDTVLSMLSH